MLIVGEEQHNNPAVLNSGNQIRKADKDFKVYIASLSSGPFSENISNNLNWRWTEFQ